MESVVPGAQLTPELAGLLKKVGATLEDVLQASELEWNGKQLGPSDTVAIASVLPRCTSARKLKCVHAAQLPYGTGAFEKRSRQF